MGNRGHVFDHVDLKSGGLQGADSGFTAGARSLDEHFDGFQAVLHRGFRGGLGSRLSGEGGGFPRTAEAQLTSAV